MSAKTANRLAAMGLIFCCTLVAVRAGMAQKESGAPAEPTTLIYSLKGPDLFQAYCAACHGATGKGGGPVAPSLKAQVPDLTALARKNGGQFPLVRVRKIIAGDEVFASHGSREMPIWGPIFHQVEEDRDYGNVRLENLAKYLESIQSTRTVEPPTGAALYQQDCAACHGSDLKGTGPVPTPYRVPPDLTTLARRHNGNFPREYISDVLRDGVVMPEHGPAEMPVWGSDFRSGEGLDEAQVKTRIAALVNYLESRQAK